MTVIAIRRHEETIEIAADSYIADEANRVAPPMITDRKKISLLGDRLVVASAGEINEAELFADFLRRQPNLIGDLFKNTAIPYLTGLVGDFKDELAKIKRLDVESLELENTSLLVIDRRIFCIYYDVQILEIDEYFAIGIGAPLAIAALHIGQTATQAAKVACALHPKCAEPIEAFTMTA